MLISWFALLQWQLQGNVTQRRGTLKIGEHTYFVLALWPVTQHSHLA